jgi:hypothetical protein
MKLPHLSVEELVLLGIGVPCVVGLVMVLFSATYDMAHSDRTFMLRKSQWECSRSEVTTTLFPMQVGKVTILQPMTSTECIEYRRKP